MSDNKDVCTRAIEEKAATMKIAAEAKEPAEESKLTAAAVLAGLVESPPPAKAAEEDQDETHSEEFHIPQRYTRSGRKRAVSFPLKVSDAIP